MAAKNTTNKSPRVDSGSAIPYTMRLPNGHTLLIELPASSVEADPSGVIALKPEAVRLLDKVFAAATEVPAAPTAGRIRALRDALGLTQRELGERLGVDKLSVSRWERGQVQPGRDAVRALERIRKAAIRKGIDVAA